MLRIRLTRTGRKNQPKYRVVVAEHSDPIKGKFIDILGYYIPITDPKEFSIDKEKYDTWIKKGALPSPTVESLVKKFS
jgi:small subunit ribosomal protein S16